MVEDINIEEIQGAEFSDEVRWGVRYGYLYRKEAEVHSGCNAILHHSLPEATTILYWLANLVITGVAYDLIKKHAKALWEKLMTMKVEIPDDVKLVLIEEDELKIFVRYVNEFASKELSATDKQVKYIREEIIADYVGETAGEIWAAKKRLPTHEEWVTIYRDANKFADDLLS